MAAEPTRCDHCGQQFRPSHLVECPFTCRDCRVLGHDLTSKGRCGLCQTIDQPPTGPDWVQLDELAKRHPIIAQVTADLRAGKVQTREGALTAIVVLQCCQIDELREQLGAVDGLLERRSAMDDLATRVEKVARLLRIAGETDPAARIAKLEGETAELRAEVERLQAAIVTPALAAGDPFDQAERQR